MLIEISIRDLALFESAELEFGSGFNVLTGQTGSGKSLSLRALELLLGQRPRTAMVRQGADSARVDGRFQFAAGAVPPRLVERLREEAPAALEDWEEGDELELVLTRTLSTDGRTRAHLNLRPVTQRLLKELASQLVEIHGQNDHQRLLEPAEQRALLDSYGGLDDELEGYRAARARWVELGRRALAWGEDEAARRDRLDLLRFQVRELEEAELSAEEIGDLRRERERLHHAEDLLSQLGGTLERLADGEGAALDVLRQAEGMLERWEGRVEELGPTANELREAAAHLEEASRQLRRFLDEVEYSPTRLEEVEERLSEVERLERKYRTDVAGLLEELPRLAEELGRLEAESGDRDACEAEWARSRADLEQAAARLTRARRRLRARMAREVVASLEELGLGGARFEVSVEPREARELRSPNADRARAAFEADQRRLAPDGADEVEFLLAANPGEGVGPLRKVASGGEAARVMLALRGALAARQTIPTLVFDEVDAGVGGRLAPRVGAHLRRLGEHYQILCITHLPAVAAVAHQHLEVEKSVEDGRTTTRVRRLEGAGRVEVIADMIAGGKEQESARREAERLLAAGEGA
jgi:DNA repair protein RecN (Recombination protein N)